MSNTFGTRLRFTGFGESHGPAIGGVLDGFPAGVRIDTLLVQQWLEARHSNPFGAATARRETDRVEFLSGIYEGVTLGTPIAFIIRNEDTRSSDYNALAHAFRPNHADYTYHAKYGIRDYRGGGRASARETAARVVAGAIAYHLLQADGISIESSVEQIGPATAPKEMQAQIDAARAEADTLGGIVRCVIKGVPEGLGEPIFGKLHAMLAAAMMSIPAAKGFEYGCGFAGAAMRGSQLIDTPYADADGHVHMLSNHSGGIQGGISNGEDIYLRVAFKPVASMPRPLDTVTDTGEPTTVETRGRHDICVVPRAPIIVKAMAALTIADALMLR